MTLSLIDLPQTLLVSVLVNMLGTLDPITVTQRLETAGPLVQRYYATNTTHTAIFEKRVLSAPLLVVEMASNCSSARSRGFYMQRSSSLQRCS
jgi:hypothetical protein